MSKAPINRPSWDDYWMGKAFMAAERSPDAQTKVGCIFVYDNKEIATGYNGFPRGMSDNELPNMRPAKYEWMIHAEQNAIANCTVALQLLPRHSVSAYITHQPCNDCAHYLWQANVHKWYIPRGSRANMTDQGEIDKFESFVEDVNRTGDNLKIHYIEPDLSWVWNLALKVKDMGFVRGDLSLAKEKLNLK